MDAELGMLIALDECREVPLPPSHQPPYTRSHHIFSTFLSFLFLSIPFSSSSISFGSSSPLFSSLLLLSPPP